jgi:hypothetical protein
MNADHHDPESSDAIMVMMMPSSPVMPSQSKHSM